MDVRTDDRVLALDDPVANHLPDPVRLAAYRVVEEALANVYRHAQATQATVELTAPNGVLEILVRDDGRGFAPGQAPAGLGVNAIAARVGQLGGARRPLVTDRRGGGAEREPDRESGAAAVSD